MKKSVVLKGVLAVLFVFAAGIFYLCTTKKGEETNRGLVLSGQNGAGSDVAGLVSASDGNLQDGNLWNAGSQGLGSQGAGSNNVGWQGIGSQGADLNSAGSQGADSKSAGSQSVGSNSTNSQGAGSFPEGYKEPEVLIYVHVCGAVKEPGVYALPSNSRVADAILCAGDFLPEAAKDYLNLAQPIFDGQKIYVPDEAEVEELSQAGAGVGVPFYEGISKDGLSGNAQTQTAPQADSPYVNINTAGESELKTLPGIGEAKAAAIVAYRKEHGAFSSCEELMQVPGIKESIYEKLRDAITVGR